jgi:hypothetical protein
LRIGHFWAFVPVEVVWISSLFRFLGGGPNVAIAMIMTMASDISTESTRYDLAPALRSYVIYY